MVRHNLEYSKEEHNTVNRYKHQAVYSLQTIHQIINTTPFLNVSFSPSPTDPFPVILPLIGQLGSFTRPSASLSDPLDLYLHAYTTSRLPALTSQTPAPGLPVCISTSVVTGIVLTLTPNTHNYNYRSATLFGHATVVEDVEEKLWAMQLITNGVVPDRWRHTRTPPTGAEVQSTRILKVVVVSGSGKVREGGPEDGVADRGDEELGGRVWTGVLPLYEQFGEPVPGQYNQVEEVPEHIVGYREECNRGNKEYAEEAARKEPPVRGKEREEE